MLKGSKKPINSPHQPGHCALCLCLVTYTHTCVLSISYQCFSLCPFFYHISAVVTVGFWLLSIQPPDFLLGIHASCSLGTCGSVGVNSTLMLGFAWRRFDLPRHSDWVRAEHMTQVEPMRYLEIFAEISGISRYLH